MVGKQIVLLLSFPLKLIIQKKTSSEFLYCIIIISAAMGESPNI